MLETAHFPFWFGQAFIEAWPLRLTEKGLGGKIQAGTRGPLILCGMIRLKGFR